MTAFEEGGAARQGMRGPGLRLSNGLRRTGRLLRRIGHALDRYYSVSDFNERLIYDLGIEPIDLRNVRDPRLGEAMLRLRRMRRGRRMPSRRLG